MYEWERGEKLRRRGDSRTWNEARRRRYKYLRPLPDLGVTGAHTRTLQPSVAIQPDLVSALFSLLDRTGIFLSIPKVNAVLPLLASH